MNPTDVVWWSIAVRAVLGTVFTVLALMMFAFAVIEFFLRRQRKENGAQSIVLVTEIGILACCIHALGSLASTAWLTWPFVLSRAPYTKQQAVAAVMILSLLVSIGIVIVLKWNQRRLLGRHFSSQRKAELPDLGGAA